ncbi:hypothetical protein [Amazonocrinis nigriterrae]|nr:hypothetical protein [Amazonocrinis nigriterrae]
MNASAFSWYWPRTALAHATPFGCRETRLEGVAPLDYIVKLRF